MVQRADLVIIGISVGVAVSIIILTLVYFGIQWYKKHTHLLQRRASDTGVSVVPIRTNGIDTSIDISASLSNSVTVRGSDYPAPGKTSHQSWWNNHHSKDRFASGSGLPRYSYKYVLC